MIVVKVEMWPKGDEKRAREIGRAHIANVGGDGERADYDVKLLKSAKYSQHNAGKVYKRGRVEGFRRHRGPWPLLFLALANALRLRAPNEIDEGDDPEAATRLVEEELRVTGLFLDGALAELYERQKRERRRPDEFDSGGNGVPEE
jgi:hypothetical protein